jgi:hypothetical protein
MKSERPMIDVAHISTARRSYTMPEEAASLLEEYANFLSDYTKCRVSPGDIIGKLVPRLRRDDLFMKWQASRNGREIGGKVKTKTLPRGEHPHV